MGLDYNKDLQIDDSKLDKEWVEQPLRYKLYSDAWAIAEDERVVAKDELARIRAEISNSLRTNPPTLTDGKPVKLTVADLENLITTDEKVLEATKDYNKKTYNSNILKNSKEAFEQRKKALEKLVDLWGMQYFGKPKNSPERTTTIDENTARSRPGIKRRSALETDKF